MPKISKEWGRCITELLAKHELTPRGAMLKANGVVSHTTIIEWQRGVVPIQIMDKAWPFLSAFPREEAIECLRAAELPIPTAWEAEELTGDELLRKYIKAMRGTMDKTSLEKHIRDILEEEANEPDGYDPEP